jgi:hypothetical protein
MESCIQHLTILCSQFVPLTINKYRRKYYIICTFVINQQSKVFYNHYNQDSPSSLFQTKPVSLFKINTFTLHKETATAIHVYKNNKSKQLIKKN